MEQIIIAAISTIGSIVLGIIVYLLKESRRNGQMSPEERNLLNTIKTNVENIEKGIKLEREERNHDLETERNERMAVADRLDRHLASHR